MGGSIMRIGITIVGVVLIIVSFWKHSVKKLAVNYAVIWALLGILLVLLGSVPAFSRWTTLLSPEMRLMGFCVAVLILFTEVQSSLTISQLTFKTRELAMHVSLLNEENERIMDELREMENAEDDAYEKNSVRS